MVWRECKGLERKIILAVHKQSKPISVISRELNKSIQIIGKTIERMKEQELVSKVHKYSKDARKTEILINFKRIKIEKTHMFYLAYFILCFVPFITSLIISLIFKQFFLLIGCSFGILPSLLFMLYQVRIKEDKVVVYKNPKFKKTEKKLEVEKKVDNVDQKVDKGLVSNHL